MLVENGRLDRVGGGKREKYSLFGLLPLTPYPLCIKVPLLDFPFAFALEKRVVVNSSQPHGIS